MNKFFRAFTLAETLITLGIIGVVAALTIPTLLKSSQDQEYKTAYKKAYTSITQAFLRASGDKNIIELSGSYGSQGMEANFTAMKSYFVVSKSCTTITGCWNTGGQVWRSDNSSAPAFIDNSGMAWRLRAPDAATIRPVIFVDTNGDKGPNQYGKDRFPLLLSNGNYPASIDSNDIFGSYPDNVIIGFPVRIIPYADVTVDTAANEEICPSVATHPCYYTSWLYN